MKFRSCPDCHERRIGDDEKACRPCLDRFPLVAHLTQEEHEAAELIAIVIFGASRAEIGA